LSINSLLLAAEDTVLSPESLRRINMHNSKGVNTINYAGYVEFALRFPRRGRRRWLRVLLYYFSMFTRSSGGKGGKNFGRWGSLKDKRVSVHGSQLSNQGSNTGTVRHSNDTDSVAENVHTFQRAALYVLGEKAQMKVSETKINFWCTREYSANVHSWHVSGNESGTIVKDGFHSGRVSGHSAYESGVQKTDESLRTESLQPGSGILFL
jgi:hypothetical protein